MAVIDAEKFLNERNEVECGKCQARLWKYKYNGPPKDGTQVRASDFVPVAFNVLAPVDGQDIICQKCGAHYGFDGKEENVWFYPL